MKIKEYIEKRIDEVLNEIEFVYKNDLDSTKNFARTDSKLNLEKKNFYKNFDLYYDRGYDTYYIKDDNKIGYISFDNTYQIGSVQIDKKYRGQGIGLALYLYFFKKLGKLISSTQLTKQGSFAIWTKILPRYGDVYVVFETFGKLWRIKLQDIKKYDKDLIDWTNHFELYKKNDKSVKNVKDYDYLKKVFNYDKIGNL